MSLCALISTVLTSCHALTGIISHSTVCSKLLLMAITQINLKRQTNLREMHFFINFWIKNVQKHLLRIKNNSKSSGRPRVVNIIVPPEEGGTRSTLSNQLQRSRAKRLIQCFCGFTFSKAHCCYYLLHFTNVITD